METMTRADLADIGRNLRPFDKNAEKAVLSRWDNIAKPIEGLGIYEKIVARIGGIRKTDSPVIDNRSLVLFFSDNGIAQSGVSQSDVEVTHKVAKATAADRSTACLMAQKAGIHIIPIDIGMKGDIVTGLVNHRISEGTESFLKSCAMSDEQVLKAIEVGYNTALQLKKEGCDLVLLGEMGVANTTTSTAVACALLGKDPTQFTGHGSGLSEEALKHKAVVIRDGIEKHGFGSALSDPFEVLRSLGGYDIAAMVGVFLGSGCSGIPVVLDGVVSLAAALVTQKLFPGITDVMIASHRPREPIARLIMDELGLSAPMDADLALGEGTGAILLVPQIDICLELYRNGLSFDGLGMDSYRRYDS